MAQRDLNEKEILQNLDPYLNNSFDRPSRCKRLLIGMMDGRDFSQHREERAPKQPTFERGRKINFTTLGEGAGHNQSISLCSFILDARVHISEVVFTSQRRILAIIVVVTMMKKHQHDDIHLSLFSEIVGRQEKFISDPRFLFQLILTIKRVGTQC